MVDVILGLQWGDEGKGKIVDFFAKDYDVIARFQGGPNAGHTLYVNDKKIVLHQIPSGIFHTDKINLIGNGVVLDAVTLKKECESVAAFGVDYKKNLFISERTHLILPTHRALDKASELSKGMPSPSRRRPSRRRAPWLTAATRKGCRARSSRSPSGPSRSRGPSGARWRAR